MMALALGAVSDDVTEHPRRFAVDHPSIIIGVPMGMAIRTLVNIYVVAALEWLLAHCSGDIPQTTEGCERHTASEPNIVVLPQIFGT